AAQALGVGTVGGWQHLDRDVAADARVAGAIDDAHRAFAEQGDDFVAIEADTGGERHGAERMHHVVYGGPVSARVDSRESPLHHPLLSGVDAWTPPRSPPPSPCAPSASRACSWSGARRSSPRTSTVSSARTS